MRGAPSSRFRLHSVFRPIAVAGHSIGRRAALVGVPRCGPRIVRTLPHDPKAYTRGLVHANDLLFESTGIVGLIIANVAVADRFGEGIAMIAGRLFNIAEDSDDAMAFNPTDIERRPQTIPERRNSLLMRRIHQSEATVVRFALPDAPRESNSASANLGPA
jgi:hypothetical protein